MDLLDILPGELAFIFGVPLVVAVILVLVAGRGDDDSAHTRTQARYLGAICLVSLFVALFAAFGTVRGLTDLIVDKAGSRVVRRAAADILDSLPGLGRLPGSGSVLTSDDADYRLAVGSALFAAAAAGVFFFHDRRARRLVPPGQIEQSATGRVAACGRVRRVLRRGAGRAGRSGEGGVRALPCDRARCRGAAAATMPSGSSGSPSCSRTRCSPRAERSCSTARGGGCRAGAQRLTTGA